MKNIRYAVFLCLHAIAFSQAQNQTENKSIHGEVAFGKYTDCLRPGGICTFGSSNNKAHANTQIVSFPRLELLNFLKLPQSYCF